MTESRKEEEEEEKGRRRRGEEEEEIQPLPTQMKYHKEPER